MSVFFCRNKACFHQHCQKTLIEATFLSALDYGDISCMRASAVILEPLDAVYHSVPEQKFHHQPQQRRPLQSALDALLKIECPPATVALVHAILPVVFFFFPRPASLTSPV